ncbi:MAG TPA: hypothetical protein VHK90_07355 [Thermoanaerobaculia bacterium]|nr:hypothetical protein [Thermoanaerobaculia bacterium]
MRRKHALQSYTRDALAEFVAQNATVLTEEEVLAILENANVTPQILGRIAQVPRLTGFHSVRFALVGHRQTPQAHAVKLVHYLYWFDLLKLSVDVKVPAPVRRAIDTQLLNRVEKLTLGERISSARRCGPALIKAFLYDTHPRVFEALLVNKRLREDDLLALVSSERATSEQLQMIADDARWSYRYAIRKALVLNSTTPRSAAASQLRYLSRGDLQRIHANPRTSVYVRRCIERLRPDDFSAPSELIDYNSGPDA